MYSQSRFHQRELNLQIKIYENIVITIGNEAF
jgi:hypothetical protein